MTSCNELSIGKRITNKHMNMLMFPPAQSLTGCVYFAERIQKSEPTVHTNAEDTQCRTRFDNWLLVYRTQNL